METVLVTGGAGYIGSHTVLDLIKKGFDVIIADDFSNSSKKVISILEIFTFCIKSIASLTALDGCII